MLIGSWADEVDGDGEPREDAGEASDPEWAESGPGAFVALLHPTEPDHRGVHADECHQGGDVADADQHGDQHDHDGRTERVLDPAEGVALLDELSAIAGPARTDHKEVGKCRETEEGGYRPGEAQVEQDDLLLSDMGSRRPGHVGGPHGQGEAVRQDEDDQSLYEVQATGGQVVRPERCQPAGGVSGRLIVSRRHIAAQRTGEARREVSVQSPAGCAQ